VLQNVAADWEATPLVPQRYCAGVCEDESAYCSMLDLTVSLYNMPCPEMCCMVGIRHFMANTANCRALQVTAVGPNAAQCTCMSWICW
jgi:hypothetical protein